MRRENMIEEAVKRMEMLGLYDFPDQSVIRDFAEKGMVYVSKPRMGNRVGEIYALTDAEQRMVTNFERQYSGLAYHVIRNEMEIGVVYSILYVSSNETEWSGDWERLAGIDAGISYKVGTACPIAYVWNAGYVGENAEDLSQGTGTFMPIFVTNGLGGLCRRG